MIPMTIDEAGKALRAGTLTSVELTKALYGRANRIDSKIGAYIYRMEETAVYEAQQADAKFAAGMDVGPLQGIPLGIKDIISTAGAPTTANSLVLDPAWGRAQGDAPVVKRLRDAGAVIMGKLVTSEFACGSPDPAKPFPIPRNPWGLDRTPGGSSSGTGAGVAAGLFLGGLGTDTGGSVRMPASLNGITGMKQTFGRVPKSGCAPLGYSLDHIGPMARSAKDCALMFQVMAGYDASDPTCADVPVDDYVSGLNGSVAGLRIGVERKNHYAHPFIQDAVKESFEAAIETLAAAGAEIIEVEIPYYAETTGGTMFAMLGEAAAYHLPDLRSKWDAYGKFTNVPLAMGVLLNSADFVQVQRLRSFARSAIASIMAGLDVLLTPTMGSEAPPAEAMSPDRIFSGEMPLFTPYWNGVGYPAMSVPMGFGPAGLPLGLQIVAKPFAEAMAFRVGDAYQQLTGFHLLVPPVAQDPA